MSYQEFLGRILKSPPVRDNRFRMEFGIPSGGNLQRFNPNGEVYLDILDYDPPGSQLLTSDVPYSTLQQVPYLLAFSEFSITTRIMSDFKSYDFFTEWLNIGCDFKTSEAGYLEEITTDIYISILGMDDSVLKIDRLINCFPKSVKRTQSSNESSGYLNLSISFFTRGIESNA